MSAGTQVPQNLPPIAREDLAKLGVDPEFIPLIVSATLRIEQSPDGSSQLSPVEAENLVEILDKVVSSDTVNPKLKNRCLRVMREVSQAHCILPKSYFPSGVTVLSNEVPHALTGFADVWKGRLDEDDVCVKSFRIETVVNPDKVKRRFYREIVGWKHISHPNVLPFLGVSETLFPFCIISPWLPNGNIIEHVKKLPEVNRLWLLAQAACGLEHLHSSSTVHSNITPGNILITEEGNARIGDFGITAIITDPTVMERINTTISHPGVTRYMAPELLDPQQFGLSQSNPSKESDVYSFAMTAYEVLSGDLPYGLEHASVMALHIVSGDRPPRPNNSTANNFLTDRIWDVIQRCWAQTPQSRLPIHSLRQEFTQSEEKQGNTPVAESDATTARVSDIPVSPPARLEPLAQSPHDKPSLFKKVLGKIWNFAGGSRS